MVQGLVLLEPVALLSCWPKMLGTFMYGSCDFSQVCAGGIVVGGGLERGGGVQ